MTAMKKRVILAGGTGTMGTALARHLASEGFSVIILSRSPGRHRQRLHGLAEVHAWNGRDGTGWSGLITPETAVVNLAGENLGGTRLFPPRWTAARKQAFLDSRLQPGAAVVEAARTAPNGPPSVLIQAGAVGYYPVNAQESLSEDTPPGEDFQSRVCVAWEASTAAVEELGVRRVILRTGLPLDTSGGIFPRLLLPFRFFLGVYYGHGRQGLPWIHMRDQVRAIHFLMEQPATQGPYNLNSPHPVSSRDFARQMARVLRTPVIIPAPAFAIRLAFGEASTLVLDGWWPSPARLIAAGFNFEFPELASALRHLLKK
jgi:uncharacterized protein